LIQDNGSRDCITEQKAILKNCCDINHGMTILRIEGLTKDFGRLRALNEVTLHVQQGEILGLIGPNGSGKTTMLNVITGFLKTSAGSTIYKEGLLTGLKPHQIAKKGVTRTFQLTSLFPNLTVTENIIRGRHLYSKSSFFGSFFWSQHYRGEEAKLRQDVMDVLTFVNLQEKGDMLARNLSAAEQRILEIAIALAAKPELLLLDEPTSGMNLPEASRSMELIRFIQQKGITVVIIEHNMKVIMQLCSRIVVLNQGIKIAEGTPQEISKDEQVISVYLGKRREKNA
jgi:branched-chain amino acid transport system ATP-binding protein